MGLSFSKSAELAEKEKQIQLEIDDWVVLRNNTISELSRVADELDLLHKRATYSKIAGGVAGAVGGGIAPKCLSALAICTAARAFSFCSISMQFRVYPVDCS